MDGGEPEISKACEQGVAMGVGYGPNGETVQVSNAACPWGTDREIMKKTVLRGKSKVSAKEVCDAIRSSVPNPQDTSKKRKVALPRRAWEEVMTAGFAKYPVGKLVNAGAADAHVQFAAPPAQDATRAAKVRYHNMLVDLCQVSLRQFTTLLAQEDGRSVGSAVPPVPHPAGGEVGAGGGSTCPEAHLDPFPFRPVLPGPI
jgi:hypothetical protein